MKRILGSHSYTTCYNVKNPKQVYMKCNNHRPLTNPWHQEEGLKHMHIRQEWVDEIYMKLETLLCDASTAGFVQA